MKFDLDSIKENLMIKYPLFGSVLANTKFVKNDSVGTAGTDGDTIYYSSTFLDALNEKEQTFVLAHEVCHIAFDHIFRSEGKDKELWNIATDSVINALLVNDGLPLVDGGVNIPEAINYNSEEMYEKLVQKKQNSNQGKSQENKNSKNGDSSDNNQNSNNSSSSGNQKASKISSSGGNVGHDSHDLWEKTIEKRNKQNESSENVEKQKEDHIKKLTSVGETKSFEKNKIVRKKQLEEIMNSIADQSHGASDSSNGEERKVGSIGNSSPLIEWRRLLKEAIKFDVDWSYSNATIEEGVVTAHLEERPRPEAEIILDTSGSIDEELLRNFLRECKNILQTSKVKVGCFDTRFYGFTEIRNERDIDNMTFKGRGGTNFNVAVNAFSKRVENKIIFTDGEAIMPSKSIDAIWVVFGNRKINPKGGKVIYIDQDQLNKMHCNRKR